MTAEQEESGAVPFQQPFHEQFHSRNPDQVAEVIRDSYQVQHRLIMIGDPAGFTFTHDVLGAGQFAVNRLTHSMTIGYHTGPLDEVYSVSTVRSGRLSFDDTVFGSIHLTAGDVALGAPEGDARYTTSDADLSPVTLTRSAVGDYAEAVCGIPGDELAFTDQRPISEAMARHWRTVVDHFRDHVLGNPAAASSPIALESAFRLLAAALLSTFPNTALAARSDSYGRPATGRVSTTTLGEIIDYLDGHADQPVGPADLTALSGIPAREIVDGLRRRRDTHPAYLLRTARLRGLHDELRNADPDDGAGVPDRALRWGFTDPDELRTAYLRTFNESPDHTLRT